MGKNIVVCCDGTGNQIEINLSNVLKLFRVSRKNEEQRVYYNAGIGTIGSSDAWARYRQNAKAIFELATGYGLDDDILAPYEFICRNYDDGDQIYLFGFSRGAYTARALAGLIHMIGLIPIDQQNIASYALRAYKQASFDGDFTIPWHFSKVSGAKPVRIKFLGVWDTVASVIVPRPDRLIPQLLTLPYTRKNPSVEVFRHAMAIDERRRMFRLNRWEEPQPFVKNPFDKKAEPIAQDIKQVWFSGCHSDIGGGYPEEESGLAKYPLDWMLREAITHGLKVNQAMRNYIVLGRARMGSKVRFTKPDHTADAHDSLTRGWRPLEYLPRSVKWMEWPRRKFAGMYLPLAEPRVIEDPERKPLVHKSAVDRRNETDYGPDNFPADFEIEQ
ncbi:T6SS phospholipase effector Tle1-like catalytic domain-containing protein [Roseibium sp. SCP14]|uniref:T6SS phospholipase effector Tle1-like catalytic domain-containing protein n=1 Tax=Roseibium sp. SCP14 TaxID=3141375 RepID=UPI00333A12BD